MQSFLVIFAVPSTPNSTLTPRRRSHLPQSEELSSWRHAEIEMFRQALDCKVPWEERDSFLEEFMKLRARTEDAIMSLISATKDLQLVSR